MDLFSKIIFFYFFHLLLSPVRRGVREDCGVTETLVACKADTKLPGPLGGGGVAGGGAPDLLCLWVCSKQREVFKMGLPFSPCELMSFPSQHLLIQRFRTSAIGMPPSRFLLHPHSTVSLFT